LDGCDESPVLASSGDSLTLGRSACSDLGVAPYRSGIVGRFGSWGAPAAVSRASEQGQRG